MVQPSLVLVTTCVPFWCWTSNGSLSKGGVALVQDSFFTSIASPTWISNVFMPFFPSACAFICIFFSTHRKSCRNSSWKSSCRGMIPAGNLAWNMQLGTLQGLTVLKSSLILGGVLEKSLNFCASPWKVLEFSSTLNALVLALALFIWVSMYLARKCYLGTLYFTSPTEDGTAILRGHPSHAKV